MWWRCHENLALDGHAGGDQPWLHSSRGVGCDKHRSGEGAHAAPRTRSGSAKTAGATCYSACWPPAGEIQSLLDFWPKRSLSLAQRRLLDLLWMIEQPHRIATCVSCHSSNFVKQRPFL